MSKKSVSRRKFIVRTGIGSAIAIASVSLGCSPLRRKIASSVDTAQPSYRGSTDQPMIWFQVNADNSIILYSPKVEMGQGIFTGMAQLAAEELEVPVSQIKVKHASTTTKNIDSFGTGGSTTISSLWIPLRELAATMREMLTLKAAEVLNTKKENLSIADGVFTYNKKKLSYGDVVSKGLSWKVPKTPKLKSISEMKYIGKPVPRVDLLEKIKGTAVFGMDAEWDNMLFGSLLRPSHVGAKLISIDTSTAIKMPGVIKIVTKEDFVGVIAESYTEAEEAKKNIVAKWSFDNSWSTEKIEEMVKVGKGKPVEIQKKGRAKRLLAEANQPFSQSYKSPIGSHAQMEPHTALAAMVGDKIVVRMSTQVIKVTQGEIAKRLGIPKEKVVIEPLFVGGGFGGKLHTPIGMQAAVLAREVERPVKCSYNRKEEFQNDLFRPPTHHVLKALLSDKGKIEAIEHNVSSGDVAFGSPILPSFLPLVMGADLGAWRGGMIQYHGIPNYRAVSWRVKLPFATSWWRSLGLLANTFAIESFMDELAEKAGKDPIDFRLEHLSSDEISDIRMKKVIEKARDESRYRNSKQPNGRAMGFACSTDASTPVAQVVELSVEGKDIIVHKVTCVIDPGIAINPDQIRAQCEGAITMGQSASMFEKMDIVKGELKPTIYGAYKMVRMKHSPRDIDVHILENFEKPTGVGEPPLGPIGAAIANALYRITGKRQREMPLAIT